MPLQRRASQSTSATVVQMLIESAQGRPFGVSYFGARPNGIDLADLENRSARRASFLQDQGVTPGAVVGLLPSGGPDFLVELFAILRAGAAVCVLQMTRGRTRAAEIRWLRNLIARSGIQHVSGGFSSRSVSSELSFAWPGITLLAKGEAATRTPLPLIRPGQLAVVQFTSGHDGLPKPVALRHGEVVAGMAAFRQAASLSPDDVLMHWLPVHRHLGLFVLLSQVLVGGTTYAFTPAAFQERTADVVRFLVKHQATATAGYSSSYDLLCDAIEPNGLPGLDLARWRVALAGGEPVLLRTLERFGGTFGRAGVRPSTMCPVYGVAEATLAVTCKRADTVPDVLLVDRSELDVRCRVRPAAPGSAAAKPCVSVGVPVGGIEVRIVGAHGEPVEHDRVGQIQVRGDAVTSGYHRDFRSTLRQFEGGWLRTGDRGFEKCGQLYIVDCAGQYARDTQMRSTRRCEMQF